MTWDIQDPTRKTVRADSRGRITLGAEYAGRLFIVQEHVDPVSIHLQPAYVRSLVTGEMYCDD